MEDDLRMNAIDKHLDSEAAHFLQRTPRSLAQLQQNVERLPLGVASSFQSHYPYPLVVDYGSGSWVTDVDGHRYLDLHSGFGCNIYGHAHPKIVAAIQQQVTRGTHFAAPSPGLDAYAGALCERVGMEQCRLCNSGTEATMDAIRLSRAATGRDLVIKIEGSYHGHHDVALLSVKPDPDEAGSITAPVAVRGSEGIPQAVVNDLRIAPFNHLAALASLLEREGEECACLILEPVMCNLGMIVPDPDYLPGVRELCDRYGVKLIFDQVKTGFTIAYGSALELYGVTPDLHCLGKAIGGGLPVGAFGGDTEMMDLIKDWRSPHYGTFSGNPLTVAAGSAAIIDVLIPEVYVDLEQKGYQITRKAEEHIQAHDLAFHTTVIGAKGGVFFSRQPAKNYRQWFEQTDRRLAQLYWLWMANRGVWMAPGADEQWTLPCVIDDEGIELFDAAFASFAEMAGSLPASSSL